MSDYYTLNLRDDIFFETPIFPEIYWVPISALGKTRYTKQDMETKFCNKDPEEIGDLISNPYELIQYIQTNCFTENLQEHVYKMVGNDEWEIHETGYKALRDNSGSCASLASIFYTILSNYYSNIGNLCIISNSGGGHVINYIYINENYYFIDLYAQLGCYAPFIPVETGEKKDFVRTTYITGGCLKTSSLDYFINYFDKYTKLRKKEFLYYTYEMPVCPPASITVENDSLNLLLPYDQNIKIVNKNELSKIKVSFVEFTDPYDSL
ncbi:hypothetical protein [Paenibacillus sp. BAC0078]